jgi:blue light- and temperature-responsive anti-repressor
VKTPSLSGKSGLPAISSWPEFSFAFQPIVDADAGTIFSYEALIRGRYNESAAEVFSRVPRQEAHRFDESSRQVAIELAARLDLDCHLNLNFLPQSVQISDLPIRSTIDAAERFGIPIERIVLEVTEVEVISDQAQFARILNRFRSLGLKLAIDDFGAGYSGLNLLADFQPDAVKIDMKLVRGIQGHGPRQAIVRAIFQACNDLGIDLIAEGVETPGEYNWFRKQGVRFFQGYLIAKPAFEELVPWCDLAGSHTSILSAGEGGSMREPILRPEKRK